MKGIIISSFLLLVGATCLSQKEIFFGKVKSINKNDDQTMISILFKFSYGGRKFQPKDSLRNWDSLNLKISYIESRKILKFILIDSGNVFAIDSVKVKKKDSIFYIKKNYISLFPPIYWTYQKERRTILIDEKGINYTVKNRFRGLFFIIPIVSLETEDNFIFHRV